ncbi:6-phosphogluconolactonase [Streptomyces sp. AJS327]|uniref:6-phosphogluconolactonase n=1 Tax=Streptomyces sp. AJS327 TaxID=2545265 RepID=UPI0015DDD87C|nr:6-phosphogluconolactonase [Streptomyces sp. AJS327]MBA0050443.1 6-phosphogluconolactonase [Streptomyces sp. AJS327]
MTVTEVLVFPDAQRLAREVAARLLAEITEAQRARTTASVVVTGGRNGNAVLEAVAEAPAPETVDWARVDVWWGDERFLPEGDPERNETQAGERWGRLPLDPARLHPMPASDSGYPDVDAAAAAYAAELAADPRAEAGVPPFDVTLLGVGPDTHVASLFPGFPGPLERGRSVVGVTGAPKPPPDRISLTLPAIRAARQVWLLAAGADKANAVAMALSGADAEHSPASAAHGGLRTLWLLDESAAAQLPPEVYPGAPGARA